MTKFVQPKISFVRKFNPNAEDASTAWIEDMKINLAKEMMDTERVSSASNEQLWNKGYIDWAGYRFYLGDPVYVLVNADNCGWVEVAMPTDDPEVVRAFVKYYGGDDSSFIILDKTVKIHVV